MCEVLSADRSITKGEQLFDSYTDLEKPVGIRRRELLRYYRFHCDCGRCEEEQAASDTRKGSFKEGLQGRRDRKDRRKQGSNNGRR